MPVDTIDIKYGTETGELSNLTAHSFPFRGVHCASMEGLLQSFKFRDPLKQAVLRQLVGHEARRVGLKIDWRPKQMLYFLDEEYPRDSDAYQRLLDEAFVAKFTGNLAARNALIRSYPDVLNHSIGKTNKAESVLTKSEYLDRLIEIRKFFILTEMFEL